MKEIEKYLGYYSLVYLTVLVICGFFQYLAVCQGKSLECAFSTNGLNTILTTTAYVITPVVAIIGFLSWKNQHNLKIHSDTAKEILGLYEKLYYKLLTIDNFYKLSQFKLKQIIASEAPEEDKAIAAKHVFLELESSMNGELLNIELQLDWVVFRVTTFSILINSSDILSNSTELKEKVTNLLKPIRDNANKTITSKEFEILYEDVASKSQETATDNIQKTILILKKYIEA